MTTSEPPPAIRWAPRRRGDPAGSKVPFCGCLSVSTNTSCCGAPVFSGLLQCGAPSGWSSWVTSGGPARPDARPTQKAGMPLGAGPHPAQSHTAPGHGQKGWPGHQTEAGRLCCKGQSLEKEGRAGKVRGASSGGKGKDRKAGISRLAVSTQELTCTGGLQGERQKGIQWPGVHVAGPRRWGAGIKGGWTQPCDSGTGQWGHGEGGAP